MLYDVMTATEFVLRLPRGSANVGAILRETAEVPAKVLGACELREGDDVLIHIAVNSQPVFEPHFEERYGGRYLTRNCLALVFEEAPTAGANYLRQLLAGGIGLEYSYGGATADGRVAVLLQTTDNAAAMELLDHLV
jgi:hypothetical protein